MTKAEVYIRFILYKSPANDVQTSDCKITQNSSHLTILTKNKLYNRSIYHSPRKIREIKPLIIILAFQDFTL